MNHNPAVIAERLRAAAEFRRIGDLHECLVQITWARSNRLKGKDSALADFPQPTKWTRLAQSLWERRCRANGYMMKRESGNV
jgi:hypothetical protein